MKEEGEPGYLMRREIEKLRSLLDDLSKMLDEAYQYVDDMLYHYKNSQHRGDIIRQAGRCFMLLRDEVNQIIANVHRIRDYAEYAHKETVYMRKLKGEIPW